mgnify:CR=1 FL=1
MKKSIPILFLFVTAMGYGQGNWTQQANFGGGTRYGAFSFSIGSKAYIGTGTDDTGPYKSDFWEYDAINQTWTQRADFAGGIRSFGIGFSIGSKGYAGTGIRASYDWTEDFWEYNPAGNTWIGKDNFPGGMRYLLAAFTIGAKGYAGTGEYRPGPWTISTYYNDFWEFDPAAGTGNQWTQKANVPEQGRSSARGFGIGNKGYIGFGVYYYDTRKNDLWEYDPSTDAWTRKANLPAEGRYQPALFSLENKGYLVGGQYYSGLKDVWEFDPLAPDATAWKRLPDFPSDVRSFGVGLSIGDNGYIGMGTNGPAPLGDWWKFSVEQSITPVEICGQTWMQKNLTVSTYRNGDPIPYVPDPAEWNSLTTGAWCYYNNDPSTGATYGKLYNWYAVNDPRGLAPEGWHIPNNSEWIALENCAGGYTLAGGALKETGTGHWTSPNTGATNSTGFTALPGGQRDPGGGFSFLSNVGNWWSSAAGQYTHYGITTYGGYYRSIFYGSAVFYGNEAYMGYPSYPIADYKSGMSVRCVKDMAPSFTVCPGDQKIYSTTSSCDSELTYNVSASGYPSPALTYSFAGATTGTGSGTGSGQLFNRGITHITVYANNTAGADSCLFTVEVADTVKPVITAPASLELCYQGNGNYNIPVLTANDNCGVRTVSFSITGATNRTGTGYNASGSFNPGISNIHWLVTDSSGNSSTGLTPVLVNPKLEVFFPDVYSAVLGRPNTIYIGYGFYVMGYGFNVVVLTPIPSGGSPFYTSPSIPYYHYQWSNGSTLPVLAVSHNTPGVYNYTVTITDSKGCSVTVSKSIRVVDVRCNKTIFGVSVKGVKVCRPGNVQKCVYDFLVWAEVLRNAEIGPCGSGSREASFVINSETASYKSDVAYSGGENSWMQKAGIPGPGRYGAVGFGIGKKGYIGLGLGDEDEFYKDFWEFDPVTNVWTQKADFGGTARALATGFSILNKGYAGTGLDAEGWKKDFWQYDPLANKWTRKSDFGGTERALAAGFSIDLKGYIGTGYDKNDEYKKDFWEYNPLLNRWSKKADFAGTERYAATGFNINNRGYIGTGIDIEKQRNDFWEYDPSSERWTMKADFPGAPRHLAAGFGIGCRGYIGTGLDSTNTIRSDFWEYDPSSNSWLQKADLAGGARLNSAGFSIAGKGYIGAGMSINGVTSDVWEYTGNCNLSVTIPDVYAVNPGGAKNTIYLGYGPSTLLLVAIPSCGNLLPGEKYHYQWSNGSVLPVTAVHPSVPGSYVYSVTITDSYGCTATASVQVTVVDIRCGNNKVKVCRVPVSNTGDHTTVCVNKLLVPALLYSGSYLGACMDEPSVSQRAKPEMQAETGEKDGLQIFPNPNEGNFSLKLNNYSGSAMMMEILDMNGRVVKKEQIPAGKAGGIVTISLGRIAQGLYMVKVYDEQRILTGKLIIQ